MGGCSEFHTSKRVARIQHWNVKYWNKNPNNRFVVQLKKCGGLNIIGDQAILWSFYTYLTPGAYDIYTACKCIV